jgi:ribonuclease HI
MPKAGRPVGVEEKRYHEGIVDGYLSDGGVWAAFCDGSTKGNPGPSGAAAALILTSAQGGCKSADDLKTVVRDYVFMSRATNNQAELKGFSLALDLLQEQHAKEARSRWIVLSDSEYMRGLFEKNHNANKNQEIVATLRKRIQDLSKEKKVNIKMVWVRAHCGLKFNELVDKYATAASLKSKKLITQSSPQPSTSISSPNKVIRLKPPPPPTTNNNKKLPSVLPKTASSQKRQLHTLFSSSSSQAEEKNQHTKQKFK